jgi:hypothetical protein
VQVDVVSDVLLRDQLPQARTPTQWRCESFRP